MAQIFKNNVWGQLASELASGATTATLSAGHGFTDPGTDWYLATLIGVTGTTETAWEIVKVTDVSTNTLTIVRAQEGTTAVTWPVGTRIELRLTAGATESKANLGAAAYKTVGTGSSDVAAGDHAHASLYQPLDSDLTALAGLSTTGLVERTGAGAAAIVTVTAAGKALLDDNDAAAQRVTLGLGNAAVANVADTPADGATTTPISSNWAFDHLVTLHAPVNDIGTPGSMGFGVGICPSLPAGMAPLGGTFDKASDTYGNYRVSFDGSVMCWIPAFFYRINHASNPTYGGYGVNSIDVKPFSYFATVAAANAAGYALHRAFYDGSAQPGFFIDKYLASNNLGANVSGGIFSSLALGIPCDTDGSQSGVGAISGCGGTNNYGMVQTAAKSRGSGFHAASLFMHKALALLSLAHAQAATATTWCAWYDAAGTTNFPKGCNNNALGDTNDGTLTFVTAGHPSYPTKPKTGSANLPAKTAHNGQASGVLDLNGAMLEVAYGLTSDGSNYYGLKTGMRLRDLTGANATGAYSFFGATGIAANYDNYGPDIGAVGGSNAYTAFGSASQTLSKDTSGEGWFATGAGIPLAEGGTNLFGNDGLWDYRPNELCPRVSAPWNGGSDAGVWALALDNVRGAASYRVGGRAALFL